MKRFRTTRVLAGALLALSTTACDSAVSYQPDDGLPFQFTLDSHGHFGVQAVRSIVTPIGQFELTTDLEPAPPAPKQATLIYIDHDVAGVPKEDRFRVHTDDQLDLAVDGRAVLQVREHFIRLTAQDDITRITVGAAGSFGARAPVTVPINEIQPFGTRTASFGLRWADQILTIAPPLGVDRYAALWGGFIPIQSCATEIEFDVAVRKSGRDAPNMGFAVAPRSTLADDQPIGASVQYEQEAPPDFPKLGSFVRPAQLPEMAWGVEAPPMAAPDVNLRHHIRVTASGSTVAMQIDGRTSGVYQRAQSCGGVAIRAWGAAFTFTDIKVSKLAPPKKS